MFDLLAKVAEKNTICPDMRALRISGKTGFATDRITTISVEGLPTEGIDVLVDCDAFMASWKATKQPLYTQGGETLHIEDGKFKAEIGCLSPKYYPVEPDRVPNGESREPGDLLAQCSAVLPFAPDAHSYITVINDYVYVTDGNYAVRAKLSTNFGETLILTKAFVQLLLQVGEPLVDFLVSKTSVTAVFEHCWIEMGRTYMRLPDQLTSIFSKADQTKLAPMDSEILSTLRKLTASANKKDYFTFGEEGITLKQRSGNATWALDYPTKPFQANASLLKIVLAVAERFCFDNPLMMYFEGKGVEGFLAAVSAK